MSHLHNPGLRLAPQTISMQRTAVALLENSGLREYFNRVLSGYTVQQLKPMPKPHRMTADSLGIEVSQVWLVAVYVRDVVENAQAGYAAVIRILFGQCETFCTATVLYEYGERNRE